MTASQRKKITAAARRGAKFLDKAVPGWARRTNIRKLDMGIGGDLELVGTGCGCVLAQLYGDYESGVSELEVGDIDQERLGFIALYVVEGEGVFGERAWPELTHDWRNEIRTRRGYSTRVRA